MKTRNLIGITAACGFFLVAACSSSDDAPTGALGGPVSGAADAHCSGSAPAEVTPAACTAPEEEAAGGASGEEESSAGGAADCNETRDDEYGPTLPNSEGADDECKYQVSWTASPIRRDQDVTFSVTAKSLATDQPLEALADGKLPLSRVELYLPCDPEHRAPAQNAKAKFSETAPGVYSASALRFDQAGRWVVRFHFYEECLDGETSPHGHIAFFVDVP